MVTGTHSSSTDNTVDTEVAGASGARLQPFVTHNKVRAVVVAYVDSFLVVRE